MFLNARDRPEIKEHVCVDYCFMTDNENEGIGDEESIRMLTKVMIANERVSNTHTNTAGSSRTNREKMHLLVC